MTTSPDRLLTAAGAGATAGDAADGRTSRLHVYVDAGVITVLEPSSDRRRDRRRVVAPGAAEAMQLLGESHDVILIADVPLADIEELAAARTTDAVPKGFPSGSWYITGDSAWCDGERPSGLRSILVGPRRPPARRPTRRCDMEARDLSAAVMEILVRETMA